MEEERKLQIEQFRVDQQVVLDELSSKIDERSKEQQKEQKQHFEGIVQKQQVAVDKMCSEVSETTKEQQKEQKQLFEDMEAQSIKQSEEHELAMKLRETSGMSVARRLECELYNVKGKVKLFDSEAQKVSIIISTDQCVRLVK